MGTYVSAAVSERYNGVVFSQFMGAETIARKHGFTKGMLDAYCVFRRT